MVATLSPVINDTVAIHTKQTAYMTYVLGAPVPRGAVHARALLGHGIPVPLRARAERTAGIALGPDSDLLIVGGEDHRTGQAGRHRRNTRRDSSRGHANVFRSSTRSTTRGRARSCRASTVSRSSAAIPSDKDNVYVVTGDSGSGMTYATIAAILITDLIEGRSNPWEALYDPSRKSLRAAARLCRRNGAHRSRNTRTGSRPAT